MPSVQPSGGERGRRSGRSRRINTSLSEINVVPLVDVMLVMLVIFMVTAPLMQRGIDVNIPEARRAEQLVSERLFVTVPLEYRLERVVQIGDDRVRIETLSERLRLEMLDRLEKAVFLRGDEEITYGELISVIDVIKESGVQEVGLVLDLPSER